MDKPDGALCDDGNACTYDDQCHSGQCSGTPIACISDPCTTRTCNGTPTCALTSVTTPETWYRDADGDGYGNAASSTVACTQPSGYLRNATDCDDADAKVRPSQTQYFFEARDGGGFDYNCNGVEEKTLTNTIFNSAYDGTLATLPVVGCTATKPNGVSGWYPSAPGCGQYGNFQKCRTYSDQWCNTLSTAPWTFSTPCAAGLGWMSDEYYQIAPIRCR